MCVLYDRNSRGDGGVRDALVRVGVGMTGSREFEAGWQHVP